MRRALKLGAMILALTVSVGVSVGQEVPPTLKDVLEEVRRLRERVDTLDQQHVADLERIRQLEKRQNKVEQEPRLQLPPVERLSAPSITEPALPGASGQSAVVTLPPATGFGQGNLLNPQITAIFDLGGSYSTNEDNKALNRFNLREAELDFRAAVTPWADGVLILAIGEEIEHESGGGIAVDTVFELEEGYINFHTLPLDLTLKAGKFRNAFGRNNLLHPCVAAGHATVGRAKFSRAGRIGDGRRLTELACAESVG